MNEPVPQPHHEPVSEFNPEMLRIARHYSGFTQTGLAKELKVSQGKVSKWEDGLLAITDADLERVSQETSFPVDFFFQTFQIHGFGSCCLYHRKKQRLSIRKLHAIHAKLNVIAIGVSRLLKNVTVESTIEYHQFDIDEYGSPQKIADAIRALWRVPLGPMSNLVHFVEAAGGIVIPLNLNTDKLDAVSFWPRGMPPLFFVNSVSPTDRWRYSLAHELGHIIMHRIPSPNAEKEANEFANQFLMPYDEIKSELRGISIEKASRLKHRWRTSMQALILRARDTKSITPRRCQSLFAQISRLGYRKREPVEIKPESPETLKKMIEVHQKSLGYSQDDLMKLVFCNSQSQFHDRFPFFEKPQFSIVG